MSEAVDRILSIGTDPADTADDRFRKRLLVGVAFLILPVAFVWGCVYWGFGERGVALTPWAYVTGSVLSIVIFARTLNFAFFRTAQFLLILVAPALGTILVGGLEESSTVLMWSLLAPLGAVAFDRPGRAWPWFGAFVATILLSVALSEVVRPDPADLPDAFVRTFDLLNIILVSFVPLIMASGGNSGSQASTLVIRAISLGEVSLRDWWRIMQREIFSGLALGGILGAMGFAWTFIAHSDNSHTLLVAITISLTLLSIVLWGTLAGSMLPLIMKKLKFDPATSSTPLVATLVDVTGIIIYFSIALALLTGTLL
jgi:cation transporter-like permease